MAPEPVAGGDPAVFVEIEVDEGEVDLASGLAWAAGATGIEERDRPGGRVELAVGVGTAGPEELVAVLGARWSARVAVIEAERWDGLLDAWRAWARPWRVGHLVVEPPWQPADPSTVGPDDVVLAIDPGRAFGSGAHPSTRLALGLLADVLTHPQSRTWPASASGGRGDGPGSGGGSRTWPASASGGRGDGPGSGSGGADDQAASGLGALEAGALGLGALEADVTVVNVGCGSGVLAVAAARLGAASVIAVDIDPVAVAATDENARRNGVADRVRVGLDPVATLRPVAEPAGAVGRVVVVANLLLPVQRELAADLDRLAGDGPLVLAGLLDAQRESALAAHPGHAVVDERHEDGWCGLVLRRRAGGRGAT